jgi:hypothetical protein
MKSAAQQFPGCFKNVHNTETAHRIVPRQSYPRIQTPLAEKGFADLIFCSLAAVCSI